MGPPLPLSCAPKVRSPIEVVNSISHPGFLGGQGERLQGEDDVAVAEKGVTGDRIAIITFRWSHIRLMDGRERSTDSC